MNEREFYVGYTPKAPAGIAVRVRTTVLIVIVMTVTVAITLVLGQSKFSPSLFEFGQLKRFEGTLEMEPWPVLVRSSQSGLPAERFLLVAPGKHGVDALVQKYSGRHISLQATLIQRGPQQALEVVPDTIRISGANAGISSAVQRLGQVTLTGEIADSKCWLGVMNPGNGKVHRDCATRCLSGGIPPVLLVRDNSGEVRAVLLTGVGRRKLEPHEYLKFVSEPVTMRGVLSRQDNALSLEVEPQSIRPATT